MQGMFLVIAATLATVARSQLSIPSRELGFVYNDGQPGAPIKLAAYIDLTCPDSQAAFPTLVQVADKFGVNKVQLKVHLFSLPYHRNSHTISKGTHVLSAYKSPKNATVYDWIAEIYNNIDSLTTSATISKTDVQVLDFLATLANKVSGIPVADFKSGVGNTDIDQATRLGWKYGCTRGVYGTPMFTINEVFVQADATWTVSQWSDLIQGLLLPNLKQAAVHGE